MIRAVDYAEALYAEAEDALGRSAHYEEQEEHGRAFVELLSAHSLIVAAGVALALDEAEELAE